MVASYEICLSIAIQFSANHYTQGEFHVDRYWCPVKHFPVYLLESLRYSVLMLDWTTHKLSRTYPRWPPIAWQHITICWWCWYVWGDTINLHRGHQSGPVMESQPRWNPSGKHLLLVNIRVNHYRLESKVLHPYVYVFPAICPKYTTL